MPIQHVALNLRFAPIKQKTNESKNLKRFVYLEPNLSFSRCQINTAEFFVKILFLDGYF